MGVVIHQYEVYLINLDPTIGHEIQKTRPCLIISPNEMNFSIKTIIIAPMTTSSHKYPTRVKINFQKKKGRVVLDQLRTVDRARLVKKLGTIKNNEIEKIKSVLQEMLVD
jgi:mRNA interferase MazF